METRQSYQPEESYRPEIKCSSLDIFLQATQSKIPPLVAAKSNFLLFKLNLITVSKRISCLGISFVVLIVSVAVRLNIWRIAAVHRVFSDRCH